VKNPGQSLSEGRLGTREVAAKLKIEPSFMRVVLRSLGKGTGGDRYLCRENDPLLAKLPTLIAGYRDNTEAAKKEKTA